MLFQSGVFAEKLQTSAATELCGDIWHRQRYENQTETSGLTEQRHRLSIVSVLFLFASVFNVKVYIYLLLLKSCEYCFLYTNKESNKSAAMKLIILLNHLVLSDINLNQILLADFLLFDHRSEPLPRQEESPLWNWEQRVATGWWSDCDAPWNDPKKAASG